MIKTTETRAVIKQPIAHEPPPTTPELVSGFMSIFILVYFTTVMIWALRRHRVVHSPDEERRWIRLFWLLLGVWALLFTAQDALNAYIRDESAKSFFCAWLTWFDVAAAVVFFTGHRWVPSVSARLRAWRSQPS